MAGEQTIYGVTVFNNLVSFERASPTTIYSRVPMTGLQPSEQILGIDFRPANGLLYGLGSTSRLYTINTATGVATQVGAGQFSPLLSGADFGFDFNPSVDRIRVVSNTDQNLRLNPDTGAGTKTRAEVLREVAEGAEVSVKFFNRAFVVMEYFGYLRRNPDALFTNRINTLNSTGDYRTLVNGFVNSPEYRSRFGLP